MFIGIDVGTSAVKIVLVDAAERPIATSEIPLRPTHPGPLWSEQNPRTWWQAVCDGMNRIASEHLDLMPRVQGIGLAGQMHGAVLLDAEDLPVRSAILWDDGRAASEAAQLATLPQELQDELGVPPTPGFTGPKILWLRQHEPEALERTRHLLLPKDYVRLQLTGERVTDVSDAAGTWLFDQSARRWSSRSIEACGVDPMWLPPVVESNAISGYVKPGLASLWGMSQGVPVVGGAGDVAAGGVGIGALEPGRGFISLGTSAQVFVAADHYKPDLASFVHAFCHAAPGRWFRMAALLNGASVLSAASRWTGYDRISEALEAVETAYKGPSSLLALPYLRGERTPHNDPMARGAIIGLSPSSERVDVMQAILEAVAFSLCDGLAALRLQESTDTELGFIGGGARSDFWGQLIASVLGVVLVQYEGSERGPAFGAARLARAGVTGEPLACIAVPPTVRLRIKPDERLHALYAPRVEAFRSVYAALRPILTAAQ